MNNNNGGADPVVGAATTDTFTNKTFNTAGAGNALQINGNAVSAVTGTGSTVVLAAGAPALTAGLLLNQASSTTANVVFSGSASSGAVDNQLALQAASGSVRPRPRAWSSTGTSTRRRT